MMSSTVATKIPIEEYVLISEILDGHAAALLLPGSATAQSKAEHIRQYIRSHIGSNVQEEVEAPVQEAPEERQESGWWLDCDSDQTPAPMREWRTGGWSPQGHGSWGPPNGRVEASHYKCKGARAQGRQ